MKSILLAAIAVFSLTIQIRAQQGCASFQYYEQEIRNNPSLLNRIDKPSSINNGLPKEVISEVHGGSGSGLLPVIRIPVVVHVVYRNNDQNISDEQIKSQIDVLNAEFRLNHADTSRIPFAFKSLAADTRIEFVLATITPNGYTTNGITRTKTDSYSFGFDDNIKFSAKGGIDAWDSDRYLNIWVGNLLMGLNGYSSILGGPKEKDGIVVKFDAFGTKGTLKAPNTKGRVAVHELGHWMGLRHIWGDQYCGNDGIDDTPKQGNPTKNCPAVFVSSCDNPAVSVMSNNYMDLTSDECTNMFTVGQRDKMRASFAEGGAHQSLLTSDAATTIGIPAPVAPVEQSAEVSFSFYPNPASNVVTVDIKDRFEGGKSITVFNHLGQQVLLMPVSKSTITLNIQSFKDGVYYLKYGSSKAVKLIKATGGLR